MAKKSTIISKSSKISIKKQADLFNFQAMGYFSYDNGYKYNDKYYDAYSGPYLGDRNHLVLLCDVHESLVVHYCDPKPLEIFKGIIENQEDYLLMLKIVERYRYQYCISKEIDPNRDIEWDLINIQNNSPESYRKLELIPEL